MLANCLEYSYVMGYTGMVIHKRTQLTATWASTSIKSQAPTPLRNGLGPPIQEARSAGKSGSMAG